MNEVDLQSIGVALRQAREARALTLHEVEMQTRIRQKYLEALEMGDLTALPSPTHARGFLRNYAQFLHLDTNAVIQDFAAATGTSAGRVTTVTAAPRPPAPSEYPTGPIPVPDRAEGELGELPYAMEGDPPPEQTQTRYVTPHQRIGPGQPRGYTGGGPVFDTGQMPAVDPAAVQQQQQPRQQQRRSGGGFGLLRSNVVLALILLLGAAIIVFGTLQLGALSAGNETEPSPEVSPVAADGTPLVTPSTTATFAPTSTSPPDTGITILDRVVIQATVVQRTWMRIIVDGIIEFEGQAAEGTVLQFEGREEIRLLAGNAAGLDVTYNGQYIGLLGERGEVVERFFNTGGAATPTLTITPSLTPTLPNTPTPRPGGNTNTTPTPPGSDSGDEP